MAMALASSVACFRPGSVSLTSAMAAPHHGSRPPSQKVTPKLCRLKSCFPQSWRKRKKTHETFQKGGSLARQEEEWGGPGRRYGTSSKGRALNCPQGLPGGTRPPRLWP